MSKNIRLSPKHGVNPSIAACFFCGQPKNEIVLFGHVRTKSDNDVEMPRQTVIDYEPCDECKAKFAQGVLLIFVSKSTLDGRPAIGMDNKIQLYPTGDYIVITADCANRILNTGTNWEAGMRALIDHEIGQKIIQSANENAKNNDTNGGAQE